MIRRFSLMFMLAAVLIAVPIGAASAQSPLLSDLPPGIAKQAEPLLKDMMDRMQGSGMTPEQMQAHMADMQTMVEQLPPGIFLQILKLMPDLEMAEMMSLHQQIHQAGGLLEQPPGQILTLVRDLAN